MPWTEIEHMFLNTCPPLYVQLKEKFPEIEAVNALYRPLRQYRAWMVHDACRGMGIREDRSLVISNQSRFVPHFFE